MRVVPLLVLIACGMPADPAVDLATAPLVAQAPPAAALDVGPLVEGAPITLSVSGAPRGATVYFFYARDAGAGPCHPTIPGLCLGLLQPTMLGQATANAAGTASRTLTVPDPLSVATARFQAVAVSGRTGAVSAVVTRVRNDGDLDGFPDPSLPTVGSVTITGSTACQPFVCTAHDVVDPENDRPRPSHRAPPRPRRATSNARRHRLPAPAPRAPKPGAAPPRRRPPAAPRR
jgi:hypothetical protein